jgi:hypothetical protein
VDMGLTLLAYASMPLKYWDGVFIVVTYLINCTPSKVLVYGTPLYKLLGANPNYSSFCVFDYACWPNLRSYNSYKLLFRSSCCVFLSI